MVSNVKLLISADENPGEIDEVAKELEHALRRNTMDRELDELNKCLEQKEVPFFFKPRHINYQLSNYNLKESIYFIN